MPSTLRSCQKCTGRFAPKYFPDYFSCPTCRMCETMKLEHGLAEVNSKYTQLNSNFGTLQDLVSADVHVCTQVLSGEGQTHPTRRDHSSGTLTPDRRVTPRSLLSPTDSPTDHSVYPCEKWSNTNYCHKDPLTSDHL